VIHYKAGNAPSVLNALRHIGEEAALITAPGQPADRLILPGVGSALATMRSLRELGLEPEIRAAIGRGVPFLGICVGLQVLFEHSEEGDAECLGIFPGVVKKFDERAVRVPQMGWNRVDFVRADPVAEEGGYFYFVNSYYAVPGDPSLVLGQADYNGAFCAMAARGNVYGAQFHVEKSGDAGLRILKRFCGLS
jgi:glutamine amidotransferase